MKFRFPIEEVDVVVTPNRKRISRPVYHNHDFSLNQDEFELDVEDVAWFYARNGNHIEVVSYPGADTGSLELYLNGSVYGAILHQRKILPLHGSSFRYAGDGIMVCGESGVGKSSLTAAFSMNGADFLTDDVSPVVFKGLIPHIWSMSDRIKLHDDSLQQLNQNKEGLIQVGPWWKKYYLPMEAEKGAIVPLNHIFVLHIHDEPNVRMHSVEGVEKFTALRNEIYRKEYLSGMRESESEYVQQLILMAQSVKVTKVSRPAHITIEELRIELESWLLKLKATQN